MDSIQSLAQQVKQSKKFPLSSLDLQQQTPQQKEDGFHIATLKYNQKQYNKIAPFSFLLIKLFQWLVDWVVFIVCHQVLSEYHFIVVQMVSIVLIV